MLQAKIQSYHKKLRRMDLSHRFQQIRSRLMREVSERNKMDREYMHGCISVQQLLKLCEEMENSTNNSVALYYQCQSIFNHYLNPNGLKADQQIQLIVLWLYISITGDQAVLGVIIEHRLLQQSDRWVWMIRNFKCKEHIFQRIRKSIDIIVEKHMIDWKKSVDIALPQLKAILSEEMIDQICSFDELDPFSQQKDLIKKTILLSDQQLIAKKINFMLFQQCLSLEEIDIVNVIIMKLKAMTENDYDQYHKLYEACQTRLEAYLMQNDDL